MMEFQICWRVLVQPSCLTLPHMPWLSGVAVPHWNAPVAVDGSVLPQPRASGTSDASGRNVAQPICLRQPPGSVSAGSRFICDRVSGLC